MIRREQAALVLTVLILVAMPVAALGYQYGLRPLLSPHRIIDIIAAAPEAGGFQPDSIRVVAGETLTLRFSAVDVTHGVAIGPGLGIDLGHIDPGHVREITLTFERGGTFTFYCNTWCSPNHWRMRGVIEVHDVLSSPQPFRDPAIEALIAEGINIDAAHVQAEDHHMPGMLPSRPPVAARGQVLIASLAVPSSMADIESRRRLSPADALAALEAANPGVPLDDLADVVAFLWRDDTLDHGTVEAALLYAQNCAACHGETGGADGPAAALLPEPPPDFTDLAHMFMRRSDVLYAITRRGGMGTNMPNFGTLFTPEETWALIDYLWRLAFP